MKYVVVQLGYAIYGVGNTQTQALASAKEWLDPRTDIESIEEYRPGHHAGDVVLAQCADDIAEQIATGNGQFPFEVINGVLIPL